MNWPIDMYSYHSFTWSTSFLGNWQNHHESETSLVCRVEGKCGYVYTSEKRKTSGRIQFISRCASTSRSLCSNDCVRVIDIQRGKLCMILVLGDFSGLQHLDCIEYQSISLRVVRVAR